MAYFMEIDLHGMTAAQAKAKLDETLRILPGNVGELTVIHGYRGGTSLQNMVRAYKHPRVEKKVLGLNRGTTIFIIRK